MAPSWLPLGLRQVARSDRASRRNSPKVHKLAHGPPRRLKSSPRGRQDPPKTAQDPSKSHHGGGESPIWAVLGRSWSDFLSSSIFDRFFDRFWSPKGCQKGALWGAKTELKTTKNRSKNHLEKRSRFRSLLRPSWDDLEPILAASWAVLGVKIVLWLQRRSFFEKSTFSNKSGVKTRLGTILGRSGSPKGVVLGGQKGPKRHQKRDQNDIKILIDFLIDFGPIWEALGTPGEVRSDLLGDFAECAGPG